MKYQSIINLTESWIERRKKKCLCNVTTNFPHQLCCCVSLINFLKEIEVNFLFCGIGNQFKDHCNYFAFSYCYCY